MTKTITNSRTLKFKLKRPTHKVNVQNDFKKIPTITI